MEGGIIKCNRSIWIKIKAIWSKNLQDTTIHICTKLNIREIWYSLVKHVQMFILAPLKISIFFMKHESLILDKEVMFNVWVSVGDQWQCPHCDQCQCQVTHHVSCVSNVPFDAGEFMNHRCVPDQGSGTIILKIYLYIHSYSLYYLVCLH